MRKCPTCGSPFSENDRVCGVCGTTLKMDPPESWLSPRFPAKPSINFGNGMYMGFGLACFIFGSFIAFSLNSYYWSQTARLINSGLAPSDTHFELFDIANMISMGTYLALAGVYALVYGSLNQYKPFIETGSRKKRP